MKKIKVTHCSNCPSGWYFVKTGTNYEGYMCHMNPHEHKCVIYTDKDADEQPLPADCPLRDGDLVIGL